MINVMTTFWRFLNEHIIEIPIIQRDYAQGRLGKEELRKTFLKDLKQALDSCKPLKLDFVYGAVESGKLNPLDGQQRLTTLWLLHWYLAYMAGAMNKDVKRVLAKFTYETRISSREFCRCLADFDKLPPPGADVVGHIQNQTWFRSAWKDDSTIQSMLRMLGGTAYNNNDGIEGVFHSCYDGECIECRLDQCPYSKAITYGEYWQRLIGTDCPIIFYSLDIHGINQTDDLYIKMNARGKPLTSFENFKADLAGYIQNRTKAFSADEKWMKLGKEDTGFVIKMDTNWMDIFWRSRSSDNAVDDIYFAFLNRYFFNAYVLQFEKTGDLQKAEDPIFDFLYGRKDGENEKIAYLGFDEIFRKVLNKDNTLLERLYNTLDNFSKFYTTQDKRVLSLFEAPWNCEKEDMEKFRFIPHYIKKESIIDFAGNRIRKIARITQPQRVVFHAICKFFEQMRSAEDAKEELLALKDWMRVVWNIVENANVDTIPGMIGCLKLIDELGSHSHNILKWFVSEEKKIESKVARDQVAEEIEKAKKIIDDRDKWEQLIRKAEGYNVFRGAIRCLYTGAGKGKIDWGNFSEKWENAESYFTSEDSRKYHCLRWLIMNCTKSTELNGIVYDICTDTWKKNLLNEDLCIAVDKFLKNLVPEVFGLVDNDFDTTEARYKTAQGDLCSSGFLEGLSYNGSHVNGCMLRESYEQLALFPNNAKSEQKKYVIANKRNALLAALGDDISTSQKHSNCNFYWGWDVYFEYNDHKFQWCRDDKVYLLDEKNQYVKGKEDKYLFFDTKGIDKVEELKDNLKELLD